MNSLNPSERTAFISRTLLHPAIVIAVPFFFNECVLRLLYAFAPDLPPLPLLFRGFLLCISLSSVLLGNIFYKERAGAGARLRELILVLLAAYVYTALFYDGPFPDRFRFREFSILTLFFSGLEWTLTVELQKRLRGREAFLKLTADKSGKELQEVLRENQPYAVSVVREIRQLRGFLTVMLVLLCLGITICRISGIAVRIDFFLPFAAFTVLYFILSAMLGVFTEMFLYFGEGVSPSTSDQRRRISIAGLFIAVCLILSFLLASDTSILPLQAIIAFLGWLMSFLQGTSGQDYFSRRFEHTEEPVQELFEETFTRAEPMPDWVAVLLDAMKNLILIGLGIMLVYFFLKPFFSRDFRSYLSRIHPSGFLRERLAAFLDWIRYLFSHHGDREKTQEYRTALKHGRVAFNRTYPISEDKRRETNTVIRGFLKILRWGRKHGILYTEGQTPAEYAGRLEMQFPSRGAELTRIVEIFEEALFSSHTLGNAAIEEYFSSITTILRTR